MHREEPESPSTPSASGQSGVQAHILIQVRVGTPRDVWRAIRALTERDDLRNDGIQIGPVHLVAGSYDAVLLITARTPEQIGVIVVDELHYIPGIAGTTTLLHIV